MVRAGSVRTSSVTERSGVDAGREDCEAWNVSRTAGYPSPQRNPANRTTSSGDNGFDYHHSIFLFHLPRIEADLFFADVLLMIILSR